jgi:hypothetical protein
MVGVVVMLVWISQLSPGQAVVPAEPEPNPAGEQFALDHIFLPGKNVYVLQDGSLEINGHWKLIVVEDPVDKDGKFPIAAQNLNSIVIRCWSTKRVCEEYRASITGGILLPVEPIQYEIASWRDGRILATVHYPASQEVLLRIDSGIKRVEMEYRREPSSGRARVFERWELE